MDYILNKINIEHYGLMILIGIIVAFIISIPLIKKLKINIYDMIAVSGLLGLAFIVGSKLLYLIINYKKLFTIKSIEDINAYINGGFVFFGGVILALVFVLVFDRFIKGTSNNSVIRVCSLSEPLIVRILQNKFCKCSLIRGSLNIKILDITKKIFPVMVIAHAFGRIGCHLAGCCYGIKYDGVFSIMYHMNRFAPNEIKLFPVQIVEAVFQLIVGFIFYCLNIKNKNIDYNIYVYLLIYSIFRFVIEYYRGDIERGFIASFSISQIISILFIITMVSIIIIGRRR